MQSKRSIQPVLNALMVFEEAARAASFTRASQSLGMAQPSVSRFVTNLERQIGVALFDRQHNRVVLTEAGEHLYEATALGLGHIRAVVDELSTARSEKALTVRCTHGFAHMWVLPNIESLRGRLKGWEIGVTTEDHTRESLVSDDELVIRFGNGQWSDCKSFQLFEEEVFLVCAPEFAEEHSLLSGQ